MFVALNVMGWANKSLAESFELIRLTYHVNKYFAVKEFEEGTRPRFSELISWILILIFRTLLDLLSFHF